MQYTALINRFLAYLCPPLFFLLASCGEPQPPLAFPFDHGPHFDARTEWWYFTGDVMTTDGKRLGFECTIFKRWLLNHQNFGFIGHVALSDPEKAEHMVSESVTSPPVPGIEEGKADMQLNNFSYTYSESEGFLVKGKGENLSVDAVLRPGADVVPHGQDGVIAMGDGMPSYYYSYPDLSTAGRISHNGSEYVIASGRTWMDHQWGNYTIFGCMWDWFSLRLDNGGSLMLFRFRDAFNTSIRSNWTYSSAEGAVRYGEYFDVRAARTYKDVSGQCAYPLDWKITVPDLNAVFTVQPLFDGQAVASTMIPDYWEGLCSVTGSLEGKQAMGSAYVELTGYCK
ncbi:MAG: lipocalin-like domain-containing protein [Pseudomonadota bacterium]